MDITPPFTSKKTPSAATAHIQSLNIKLNQQLDVKVLSSTIETQNLTLQITQPKKSIQVQSNLPIETKPGQTLRVVVSKLTPVPEFKVISASPNTLIDLKKLTLKQITLLPGNVKTSANKTTTQSLNSSIISAKIISITDNKVLLKLPSNSSTEQINTAKKSPLQYQGSVIQLPKEQLTQPSLAGDKIQLEILKKGTQLEYNILEPKPLKLKTGQSLSATIINIKNHTLQIKLPGYNQAISLKPNQLFTSSSKTGIEIEPKLQALNFLNFKKGQHITLEVIKAGAQAQFKLVSNPSSSEQLIQQAFKQNLPNQQQADVLLNQIIQQLPNINKSTTIPETLKRLAREILDSLEHKNIQDPKQLKKAISNSGLFLEAKLAKTDEQSNLNIHPDFKNKLFKFNHALKHNLASEQKLNANEINLIKELQQKTENSLAKVILNQLASLPKEDNSRQVWILDLPFLNKETAESIEVKITQEHQNNGDDDSQNWAVTITISPPGLGTIHCNVSCYDKTINTIFWSDTQSIVSKIDQNLDYLKSQFEAAGIETGHMSAQTGTPPSGNHQQTGHQDSHLVNQKV